MPHTVSHVCVILLFLVQLQSTAFESAKPHVVYVDNAIGVLNETCWNGDINLPCKSLYLALEAAQMFNFTTIIIQPSLHDYSLPNNTKFQWAENITIAGNGSNVTIICEPGAGLTFFHSAWISLHHITLRNCGALHNSTSTQFPPSKTSYFLKCRSAVYFLFCKDLTIYDVNITQSNGVGLVLYDSVGRITIRNSRFSHNYVTAVESTQYPGGGGVYIEFSYCIPGDTSCGKHPTIITPYSSNASYLFEGCHFEGNIASDGDNISHQLFHPGKSEFTFGKGGGLSIFILGNAQSNDIVIQSCFFQGNRAKYGAGLFIQFEDYSIGNSVLVKDSTLLDNQCYERNNSIPPESLGGGAKVDFTSYPPHLVDNSVSFIHCNFTNNSAHWGGALSFASVKGSHHSTNVMLLSGCIFQWNQALVGAAIDASVWLANTEGYTVRPRINNCTFFENFAVLSSSNAVIGTGIGIVYMNGIPANFSGIITFKKNVGTSLVVSGVGVAFLDSAVVEFTENEASRGGGIAFYGTAWITVYEQTQVIFYQNNASIGGAMYALTFAEHNLIYSDSCFIQYHNIYKHPDHWTSVFTFSDNHAAGQKNSITATSILPCVWPSNDKENASLEHDINETFCWKNWNYSNNDCINEVTTAPAYIDANYPLPPAEVTAFPGRKVHLPLKAFDELHNDVTNNAVYTALLIHIDGEGTIDNNSSYISHNVITVHGSANSTILLGLEAIDNQLVFREVAIRILPCPPGFILTSSGSSANGICTCTTYLGSIINCSEELFQASLSYGYCMTYNSSNGTFIVGSCPYTLYSVYYSLPENVSDLDKRICGPLGRTGLLCSACKEGYGMALYSYDMHCTRCTSENYNWLKFIAAEFLPITVFFLIVVTFRFSATSPAIQGFVFYSQITGIPINFLHSQLYFNAAAGDQGYVMVFYRMVFTCFSMWNLYFLNALVPSFCLNENLTILQWLAMKYIMAFYPLILLAISYICIEMYDRKWRPIVYLWVPFHKCFGKVRRSWNMKTSFIDSFATFLLLSYMRFLIVSVSFLTPSNLYNEYKDPVHSPVFYGDAKVTFFGGKHLPYAIFAMFVLLTFVALPPLLLLLYPLKCFQKFLNFCRLSWQALHTFVDVFQGSYKNGTNGTSDCRYVAGLYFIFRIVYSVIMYTTVENFELTTILTNILFVMGFGLFALIQPYKKSFYNKLDATFFAILLLSNQGYGYTSSSVAIFVVMVVYLVGLLPLLYALFYAIYWLISKTRLSKCFKTSRQCDELQPFIDKENRDAAAQQNDESLPDRIVNPCKYRTLTGSRPSIMSSTVPDISD